MRALATTPYGIQSQNAEDFENLVSNIYWQSCSTQIIKIIENAIKYARADFGDMMRMIMEESEAKSGVTLSRLEQIPGIEQIRSTE